MDGIGADRHLVGSFGTENAECLHTYLHLIALVYTY
jgi:hypothetical protein